MTEAVAKGADAAPKRRSALKPGGRRDQLDEAAERLGDRLDTRVRIALGARKGQIVIDFATVDDLNRILHELGVSA